MELHTCNPWAPLTKKNNILLDFRLRTPRLQVCQNKNTNRATYIRPFHPIITEYVLCLEGTPSSQNKYPRQQDYSDWNQFDIDQTSTRRANIEPIPTEQSRYPGRWKTDWHDVVHPPKKSHYAQDIINGI